MYCKAVFGKGPLLIELLLFVSVINPLASSYNIPFKIDPGILLVQNIILYFARDKNKKNFFKSNNKMPKQQLLAARKQIQQNPGLSAIEKGNKIYESFALPKNTENKHALQKDFVKAELTEQQLNDSLDYIASIYRDDLKPKSLKTTLYIRRKMLRDVAKQNNFTLRTPTLGFQQQKDDTTTGVEITGSSSDDIVDTTSRAKQQAQIAAQQARKAAEQAKKLKNLEENKNMSQTPTQQDKAAKAALLASLTGNVSSAAAGRNKDYFKTFPNYKGSMMPWDSNEYTLNVPGVNRLKPPKGNRAEFQQKQMRLLGKSDRQSLKAELSDILPSLSDTFQTDPIKKAIISGRLSILDKIAAQQAQGVAQAAAGRQAAAQRTQATAQAKRQTAKSAQFEVSKQIKQIIALQKAVDTNQGLSKFNQWLAAKNADTFKSQTQKAAFIETIHDENMWRVADYIKEAQLKAEENKAKADEIRTDANNKADQIKTEADNKASDIKSKAQEQANLILAEAESAASQIKSEGDASATQVKSEGDAAAQVLDDTAELWRTRNSLLVDFSKKYHQSIV